MVLIISLLIICLAILMKIFDDEAIEANDDFFHGVVSDPRPDNEKANDYDHEEISGGPIVNWVEKIKWNTYSKRNQNGSSSCIGQGTAKALEIVTGTIQSAHPTYRRRSNFPSPGMYLQNAGDILKKQGTTTEVADPSQNLSEIQMNSDVLVSTPTIIDGYAFLNTQNIDAIASLIQSGTPVVLTFKSTFAEWAGRPIADPSSTNFFYHCVCGVDTTLYMNEKCIIIEDSWDLETSLSGQRIITESYLKARCTGAMYLIPHKENLITKPIHTFSRPLIYGMMNDDEVRALQDLLKWKGFLSSTIPSTGNFYNATAHALQKWQVASGIMDFANVTDFSRVRFGPASITEANKQLA